MPGVPLVAGSALALGRPAGLRAGRRLARRGGPLPAHTPGQGPRGKKGQ